MTPVTRCAATIVIPCFAEGPLLLEAVRSAEAQTRPPLEILVVNDGSHDEPTRATCRWLEDRPGVRVLWLPLNRGLSAARNAGFEAARGDVLVPLDADDVLPPNALAYVGSAFDDSDRVDFVTGRYLRRDAASGPGRLVDPGEADLGRMLAPRRLSLSTSWRHLGTSPLRRSLWERIGGYDPSFGSADVDDVEFWIRAFGAARDRRKVPAVIYEWRRYLGRASGSVSPLAWRRLVEKHRDTYERLGIAWRARELLLLAAKFDGDAPAQARLRSELLATFVPGRFHLSTLLALAVPAAVVRRARRPTATRRPAGER